MVNYKVALGVLLSLATTTTTCDGFITSSREMSVRKSTSIRRHVSVSSSLDQFQNDDGGDSNDNDPTRKLLDTVETLGESLTEAMLRDDEDHAHYERILELKKQRMRDRLVPGGWVVNFSLNQNMGLSLAQVDTACQLSSQVLDVDTLRYESISNFNVTALQSNTDANFRGVVVLAVKENEQGWAAGIRPGDIVVASSATVGEVSDSCVLAESMMPVLACTFCFFPFFRLVHSTLWFLLQFVSRIGDVAQDDVGRCQVCHSLPQSGDVAIGVAAA